MTAKWFLSCYKLILIDDKYKKICEKSNTVYQKINYHLTSSTENKINS